MRKRIIIPTLALSTLLAIGLTANAVSADDFDSGRTGIIQRLAEKFNVPEDDVEAVFDAHRDERHEAMQELMEERLSEAVAEGKITEEQKQALIAKREDYHEQKGELHDLDPSERREAMQAHRNEMRAWAEENGIDLEELGHHRSAGGHALRSLGEGGFKRGLHHFN